MSSENAKKDNKELDLALRPKKWEDYVGQEKLKKNLEVIIKAAKQREEPIEHLLFHGSAGLGKTSLSYLVAREIGSEFKVTSGPAIERVGDLAAILTNLEPGSVLFVDECHRINRTVEEYLYPAMEDFKLNLILGKGPMARTMEMRLPPFTLIGATTRLASLSGPLRSRFGAIFNLSSYSKKDIKKILKRSASLLDIETEEGALDLIANSSRATPRTTNHLLKRVRDFAQVKGGGKITEEITQKALRSLEIDKMGLTTKDRELLRTIIKKFHGGPVGLQALAAATHEEKDTILDIYEPYLMQTGFVERTPRGRVATEDAYKHLGLKTDGSQKPLI